MNMIVIKVKKATAYHFIVIIYIIIITNVPVCPEKKKSLVLSYGTANDKKPGLCQTI
jgi:hypothetical protein